MSNHKMSADPLHYTVDVKVCRKCRYADSHCCNYLIWTGKKREHDGKTCYSFEPYNVRKRRSSSQRFYGKSEPVPANNRQSYEDYVMTLQHMGAG